MEADRITAPVKLSANLGLGSVFKLGWAAQGVLAKRDKESDDGNSGTIDEELDAVSRRPPPLALRDSGHSHARLC
jgi:hypothetical protein